MPLSPENRKRYPKNWKTEMRPAMLARAGHRCEGSTTSAGPGASSHGRAPSAVVFGAAGLGVAMGGYQRDAELRHGGEGTPPE
jgi:hypothetical protein